MRLPLYKYRLTQEWAETCGEDTERQHFGVLAQELAEVMPQAVRKTSDVALANGGTIEQLMVVDKERLFMESVGAMQELGRLASALQARVEDLESRSASASSCDGNCRKARMKRRGTVADMTTQQRSVNGPLNLGKTPLLRRRTSCPDNVHMAASSAHARPGSEAEDESACEAELSDAYDSDGDVPVAAEDAAAQEQQPQEGRRVVSRRERMFKVPPGAVIIEPAGRWQRPLPTWLGLVVLLVAFLVALAL